MKILLLILTIVILFITIVNFLQDKYNHKSKKTHNKSHKTFNTTSNKIDEIKSSIESMYRGNTDQTNISNCAKCHIEDYDKCKDRDCIFDCKQGDSYCYCLFGCFDKDEKLILALNNDCSQGQLSEFDPDKYCKEGDDSWVARPL